MESAMLTRRPWFAPIDRVTRAFEALWHSLVFVVLVVVVVVILVLVVASVPRFDRIFSTTTTTSNLFLQA